MILFVDTECFPNYWLLKVRAGSQIHTFRLRTGETFNAASISSISTLLDSGTVVSFNGIYYDVPMIGAALAGYSCEQLKWLNDKIILEKAKPWELGISDWKPADHIDIMEVLPGSGSQKTYGGRIHCRTIRSLPYDPGTYLTVDEMGQVDDYCETDVEVLEALYHSVAPQLDLRRRMGEKYGIDLRSKSDAQLGELVIKLRCEQMLGHRIYKPEIDWNVKFRYEPPSWLSFQSPQLVAAFEIIKRAIFTLGTSGSVAMPLGLEGLEIPLGKSRYRLGIGGLHSKDARSAYKSDSEYVLLDKDVASYYPNLILNSGKYPPALGPTMPVVYRALKDERLEAKHLEKQLKGAHQDATQAHADNEGGKIVINGSFGKLGSPYSILFAPEMLIQTTVTGQLALLMLIEWHEMQGISVVSANTDGVVILCPRAKLAVSDNIVKYWEKVTGLEMETSEYRAIYTRDVNNYFAIKASGEVKRKGEYAQSGLIEKKNPDVEICADAVAEFLANETPIIYSLAACRDVRKFVTIQKVSGGGVKLWGEGPRKGIAIRDMTATLLANGWIKQGRKWSKGLTVADASSAYRSCFDPQTPEYLGKVVRWYYSTRAPGPIIYNTNGNTVSLSYGARPCMMLPDAFPDDVDYEWYFGNCQKMLRDVDAI